LKQAKEARNRTRPEDNHKPKQGKNAQNKTTNSKDKNSQGTKPKTQQINSRTQTTAEKLQQLPHH